MKKTIGREAHRVLIDWLIAKRKEARLTQRDLAARLQVRRSKISLLETYQRRIDVVELIDLCKAIGCSQFDAVSIVTDAMNNE